MDVEPNALQGVRELLELLLVEIRGLRADLANRREAPRVVTEDRQILAAVLPAIATAVGDRLFTVSELQRHARLAEFGSLRAAIERAGGGNRLGRLLKRAAGYDVGGLRVEHIGEDRDGLVFTVVSAANCGEVHHMRAGVQTDDRGS
jgi:hypothetical protein